MKKIILISCVAFFINCKPQKNDKPVVTQENSEVKINKGEKRLNDNYQNITNKKNDDIIKISNPKEYNSMIIKYQENLIVPKEDLEKIPANYREQITSLFSKPIYYELKTNIKQSVYQSTSEDSKVYSSSDAGHTDETTIILPTLNVYKDFDNLDIIKQDQLVDKTYLIVDKLNKIDWKITNEKVNINKFVCKKATAVVNNKKIIAYFTEEITINDGPSIFYGLPGLILKVEAPDRTYTVLEISYKNNLDIQKLKKGSVVSQKEFDEITKKMKENPTTTIHNEVRQ